jgi:hypothetical protein
VRKLQEYYAVLQYYKYRKREWSAADASEPECVACGTWVIMNIKQFLVKFLDICLKISFMSE